MNMFLILTEIIVTLNLFVQVQITACYVPEYHFYPVYYVPEYGYYNIIYKPTEKHTTPIPRLSTTGRSVTKRSTIVTRGGLTTAATDAISPDTDVSTTTSSTTEVTTTRPSCNIWCWIRRVGLFIVQQLLSDE